MFNITMSDTDLLKNSVPIIAEIIDEGVFKVDSNGLSLVAPDRSMIAVVNFRLLSSAFEDFKVNGEDSLGLNLGNLVSVIKRIKSNEKVTLSKDENSNKLKVIMKGNGTRQFEIPLLDIKEEKPPLDQLNFKGKIEIDSSILEEGISDADIVDDSVVFETSPELFRMWAKGDLNSSQMELKKGENGLSIENAAEAVKSRYPLEYMKKIIKASKLSSKVSLEMANDYPLRLVFKEMDKVNLSFILAPRVEE